MLEKLKLLGPAACAFQQGRDFCRATYTPDEPVCLFMQLHKKGIAEGVFPSSGVATTFVGTSASKSCPARSEIRSGRRCGWPTGSRWTL